MMPVDHLLQSRQRALPVIPGLMGIDRACIEQFARRVDHGDLAARAKAGIDAQDGMSRERRLAEQCPQVVGKDLDRMGIGRLAFFAADIALDGGEQKSLG